MLLDSNTYFEGKKRIQKGGYEVLGVGDISARVDRENFGVKTKTKRTSKP